jgi:hypothetical protein
MLLTLTLSYSSRLLEHFSYKKVKQTLRQIFKILKMGLQEKSFCAREKGTVKMKIQCICIHFIAICN